MQISCKNYGDFSKAPGQNGLVQTQVGLNWGCIVLLSESDLNQIYKNISHFIYLQCITKEDLDCVIQKSDSQETTVRAVFHARHVLGHYHTTRGHQREPLPTEEENSNNKFQ